MFRARRDHKTERFYLFAGMGGRAMRRKHKVFLFWSLAAALVVSGLMALGLYWMNRP
jgi:hypothetical protein